MANVLRVALWLLLASLSTSSRTKIFINDAPPQHSCAYVGEVWGKLAEVLTMSGFSSDRQLKKMRHERLVTFAHIGCNPYQLFDDFSWLRYVQGNWIPPSYEATVASLASLPVDPQGVPRAGLHCKCTGPLHPASLSDATLRVMLWTLLLDHQDLQEAVAAASAFEPFLAAHQARGGVVAVGHIKLSNAFPLGNRTGAVIDKFPWVMRFDGDWDYELAAFAGTKRNLWLLEGQKQICGCDTLRCCNLAKITSLWARLGNEVDLYVGDPPPGHTKPARAQRTTFVGPSLVRPSAVHFWLWLQSRVMPQIRVPFPLGYPLRPPFKGLFMLLLLGMQPTVVAYRVLHLMPGADFINPADIPGHHVHPGGEDPTDAEQAAILGTLIEAGLVFELSEEDWKRQEAAVAPARTRGGLPVDLVGSFLGEEASGALDALFGQAAVVVRDPDELAAEALRARQTTLAGEGILQQADEVLEGSIRAKEIQAHLQHKEAAAVLEESMGALSAALAARREELAAQKVAESTGAVPLPVTTPGSGATSTPHLSGRKVGAVAGAGGGEKDDPGTVGALASATGMSLEEALEYTLAFQDGLAAAQAKMELEAQRQWEASGRGGGKGVLEEDADALVADQLEGMKAQLREQVLAEEVRRDMGLPVGSGADAKGNGTVGARVGGQRSINGTGSGGKDFLDDDNEGDYDDDDDNDYDVEGEAVPADPDAQVRQQPERVKDDGLVDQVLAGTKSAASLGASLSATVPSQGQGGQEDADARLKAELLAMIEEKLSKRGDSGGQGGSRGGGQRGGGGGVGTVDVPVTRWERLRLLRDSFLRRKSGIQPVGDGAGHAVPRAQVPTRARGASAAANRRQKRGSAGAGAGAAAVAATPLPPEALEAGMDIVKGFGAAEAAAGMDVVKGFGAAPVVPVAPQGVSVAAKVAEGPSGARAAPWTGVVDGTVPTSQVGMDQEVEEEEEKEEEEEGEEEEENVVVVDPSRKAPPVAPLPGEAVEPPPKLPVGALKILETPLEVKPLKGAIWREQANRERRAAEAEKVVPVSQGNDVVALAFPKDKVNKGKDKSKKGGGVEPVPGAGAARTAGSADARRQVSAVAAAIKAEEEAKEAARKATEETALAAALEAADRAAKMAAAYSGVSTQNPAGDESSDDGSGAGGKGNKAKAAPTSSTSMVGAYAVRQDESGRVLYSRSKPPGDRSQQR
eukprot:jgi/Mesvir1/3541/Mv12011-RA.1